MAPVGSGTRSIASRSNQLGSVTSRTWIVAENRTAEGNSVLLRLEPSASVLAEADLGFFEASFRPDFGFFDTAFDFFLTCFISGPNATCAKVFQKTGQ